MAKKIVILTGSPRVDGNSEKLVAAFKTGAESSGKTVTVFRTADMKIGGCRGCVYCQDNRGKCAQTDDMAEVLAGLHEADAIVFASPVYFFSFTAQLKLAIDRMYPLKEGNAKQAAILLACADETTDTAEGAMAIYQRIVEYYGWNDAGVIIAAGVEDIGDIDGKIELENAKRLGAEI